MKRYRVTVSYRPNANSLRREKVTFHVQARNKQLAIFRAGWVMRVDEKYHVAESVNVEVGAVR